MLCRGVWSAMVDLPADAVHCRLGIRDLYRQVLYVRVVHLAPSVLTARRVFNADETTRVQGVSRVILPSRCCHTHPGSWIHPGLSEFDGIPSTHFDVSPPKYGRIFFLCLLLPRITQDTATNDAVAIPDNDIHR